MATSPATCALRLGVWGFFMILHGSALCGMGKERGQIPRFLFWRPYCFFAYFCLHGLLHSICTYRLSVTSRMPIGYHLWIPRAGV